MYYKSLEQKRGNYKDYLNTPDKVGNLARTKRIMHFTEKMEGLESQFMAVAKQARRADEQREARRAKR